MQYWRAFQAHFCETLYCSGFQRTGMILITKSGLLDSAKMLIRSGFQQERQER
jgi:hypothetical protein